MRRLLAPAVAVAWLVATAAGASDASASFEASFDYLYVEANEGGSSGGHAAIRFGSETYHFQNSEGLLVLDRERTDDFLHDYALVNNRTVEASRVALREADAATLRAAFDHRYHVQRRQLDVARALEEDRELLQAWSRGEDLPIPGLGYFALSDPGAPSATVEALRRRIAERYGESFLAGRRRDALEQLHAIAHADPTLWPATPPDHHLEDPPLSIRWARSYRDAAASVGAVDVLEAGAGLDASACIAPEGPRYWLDARELEALRTARPALEESLVRLAGSPRIDWGRPFAVTLARLLAVDASLRSGRLVVLDVIPDEPRLLPHAVLESRLDTVTAMLRFGSEEVEALRAARAEVASAGAFEELLETRFESVVNRVVELQRAASQRRELRLARGALLPLRAGATHSALPRRPLGAAATADDLRRIAEREAYYRDGLETLYGYHLITHNCVSELFHTLDTALAASVERSEEVLGGHVDGDRDLHFIPFVSARAVDARYRVVGRRVVPSYREMQIEQMRRVESSWWVALRESNTLTARSYRRGYGDSYFLFFTDDQLLLRPLLGAFNLVAASVESVAGLLWSPVDRGETLLSGLEGMLVSLPELAFWNIRKGSNDWVPPQPQSLDPPAPDEPRQAPKRVPPAGHDG